MHVPHWWETERKSEKRGVFGYGGCVGIDRGVLRVKKKNNFGPPKGPQKFTRKSLIPIKYRNCNFFSRS